jgi:hypothetical protein
MKIPDVYSNSRPISRKKGGKGAGFKGSGFQQPEASILSVIKDRAQRFRPSAFCGLIFDILRFALPPFRLASEPPAALPLNSVSRAGASGRFHGFINL